MELIVATVIDMVVIPADQFFASGNVIRMVVPFGLVETRVTSPW